MTELRYSEQVVLDRLLAQANPVDVDELPDPHSATAEALYTRLAVRLGAGGAHSALGQRRPRRLLVAAFAASLLLVAGVAVAAVTLGPWWEGADQPVNPEIVNRQLAPQDVSFPPTADRSRARTVARADGAALVAAPVGESGYCLVPSLPESPDLGFSCVYQVTEPAQGTSDDLRSYARPATQGTPRWIVYGRITDPRAATLDLSAAAGTPFKIDLQRGGFFVANVPASRWQALDNAAGRGRILDARGATLRTGCVSWGPSPADSAAGQGALPFWSDHAGPCGPRMVATRPTIDLSKAEKLVELELSDKFGLWDKGTTVALWRAPTRQGGECIYLAKATPRAASDSSPDDPRTLPGGGICADRLPASSAIPGTFATAFSWTRDDGGYGLLLRGQVDPTSRIVKVTLRSTTAEKPIPFANGFYLAQLVQVTAAGALPPGGPYALVGYDAGGNEVATQDLAQTIAEGRPTDG